ncbi:SDR family oxidoreductase [Roseomonas sp. OT10]|uniref:SDR family oxidoreductase n=1 Tax=Roseomonas cutis TaxID=2897332 RepID=UPI001E2DDE3C|nr:SDR family oxidoreductase [Roseomonas sp. OT10]UFN47073.1 SDR family oxidoreductase [Roseomonas sp. OT10]
MAGPDTRPVLLLTGAGRGIGAAIARLAAARGWDLLLTYRGESESAEATALACRGLGARTLLRQADAGDPAEVRATFAEIDSAFGRLDGLVNNAGIVGRKSRLADTPDEVWETVFRVNVLGAAAHAREAVRRMSTALGGRGGAIVNVSSRASEIGGAGEWIHYAASKGALDTLTLGLAREVGAEGIRVNAVNPGLIGTELHARAGMPDRLERLSASVPMGRPGTAEEVAEAVLWLLSGAASYVNGALLPVGGGR